MNFLSRRLIGLRARILFTVGVSTSIVMMLLSWGLLYSWRHALVQQEIANAQSVSRAFSVAVVDALIFADQDLYQSEGFLDNYVMMFMNQNPRLRAITILDEDGRSVARSWDSEDPPWISGPLPTLLTAPAPWTTLAPRSDGQWVLETILPLRSGHRSWGVLVLSVEADSIRAQLRRNFIQLALFSSSVTSVLLLLLWLLLSRLLGSLQALVTAMDTVDFHAVSVPALPSRGDEIGILYQHFHRMQQRVEQSRVDLLSAQHQVWHAERLAAIGRLASGLAHEINNPINGVRSCIYAIRENPTDHEQTAQYLDMMDEGLTGASEVLRKLLGFARKQQTAPGPLDLNEAVQTVARLVSFNMERKNIALGLDLHAELPPVLADRQLMQEVIMNLLINAIDAVDQEGCIEVASTVSGDRVQLTVLDNGAGIAPEALDRIFDPFFTTKKTGEGTGLGLSICLGIVQASGGTLDVVSPPGQATCFTLSLPVLTGSVPEGEVT